MFLHEDEALHTQLRTNVVEHVLSNREVYTAFFDESETIESWSSRMKANAWGDGICLRASAIILERIIIVFRRGSTQAPSIFFPSNLKDDSPTSSDAYFLELDEEPSAEHYEPLIPISAEDAGAMLAGGKSTKKKTKKKKAKKIVASTVLTTSKKTKKKKRKLNKKKNINSDAAPKVVENREEKTGKRKASDQTPAPAALVLVQSPVVEMMGTCAKCMGRVERSRAKISGKAGQVWVCKTCHSRTQQLYKMYGKWPTEHFKTMGKSEQTQFFNDVKDKSDAKSLKLHYEERVTVGKSESLSSSFAGEYLPLSVYERRGFNAQLIAQLCNDKKDHPVLGTVYRVAIDGVAQKTEETHTREQVVTVHDGARVNGSPADRENARSQMASATQLARQSQKSKKVTEKYLHRVVKLVFSLTSVLANRYVKQMNDCAATKTAAKLKDELNATKKMLSKNLASGSPDEVDVKALEATLTKAQSVIDRLTAIIAAK